MHIKLKLKSLALLVALLAGFAAPVAVVTPAEAQALSDRRPNVSRQQQGRPHVNRSQQRSHVGRPHARQQHHRPRNTVRHHHRNNIVVVQPRRHWNRGGAVAAGAALGFIAGAAASQWAGPPPRAGYCWYYTTPARTHGFWDWCPR